MSRNLFQKLLPLITAFAWIVGTPPSALAQHAGDIVLKVQGGQIVPGALGANDEFAQQCVFGVELGEIFPNFADEPGFDSTAGTFPVPSSNGFRLLDAVRAWDGSDFDAFSSERMGVGFGPLPDVLTPISTSTVTGFTLPVAADGTWHRHLEYLLSSPADDGIYLMKMSIFSNHAGVAESDPFYLVFNNNMSEVDHDAAIAWVEENMCNPVPEPSSLMLAAIGAAGLAVTWRRRRRRAG
ncbi:MAG: PEP-CTERM sorting domain-containing protein [Pirellulales bacterium]|nr:PEP-CTERM sorting domain-containing protein [Pirellulales bacterium]